MRPGERILLRGLGELGIEAGEAELHSFMTYLDELRRWNRVYNLTGLKTERDIIVKHFLDSCLYLKVLDEAAPGPGSIADVGSGAGVPGIPLKILRPEADIYLIEPSQKKSAFLRHMTRTLSFEGICVVEKRLEEVRGMEVDVAVTRALFKTGEFVKKASRIVKKHGLLVLSKGPGVRAELRQSGIACEVRVLGLPLSGVKRYMVLVRNE